MSNPKEKAKELVEKFKQYADNSTYGYEQEADKQCALIAINEIIEQWEYIDTYLADLKGELNPNLKFWIEVEQEIEKL